MARETIEAKAKRYLAEGRVRLIEVSARKIDAVVHGETGTWRCGWHPKVRGGWWCICPAHTPTCCHLDALKLVADPLLARDGISPWRPAPVTSEQRGQLW